MHQRIRAAIALLTTSLLLPSAASAVDGVIELNDARATAGSITPGDAAGYPVTLSGPGSYRLTGDLFVSGSNSTVIEVTTGDVTIDLNGFTIRCLYFITPCAGNGTGLGIDASGQPNVTVRNGTVRDVGGTAIELGSGGRVENVRVIANNKGIEVHEGRVSRSYVDGNLTDGIHAVDSWVEWNQIRNNALGIRCGLGTSTACRLHGNMITRNTSALFGAWVGLGRNHECDASGVACTGY